MAKTVRMTAAALVAAGVVLSGSVRAQESKTQLLAAAGAKNGAYTVSAGVLQTAYGLVLHNNAEAANPKFLPKAGAAALSSEGTDLVLAEPQNGLVVYKTETGQKSHTINAEAAGITALSLSPQNRLLASGDRDGTVKLWRFIDGQLLAEPVKFTAPVKAIAFSVYGKYAAFLSEQDELAVFDFAAEKTLWKKKLDFPVTCLMFAPKEDGIYVGSKGFIALLKSDGSSIIPQRLRTPGEGLVGALGFDPTLRMIAVGLENSGIAAGYFKRGEVAELRQIHYDEDRKISSVKLLTFSPDGAVLSACGASGYVFTTDINSPASVPPPPTQDVLPVVRFASESRAGGMNKMTAAAALAFGLLVLGGGAGWFLFVTYRKRKRARLDRLARQDDSQDEGVPLPSFKRDSSPVEEINSEPVAESAPEPVPEAAPEPAPEPAPESASVSAVELPAEPSPAPESAAEPAVSVPSPVKAERRAPQPGSEIFAPPLHEAAMSRRFSVSLPKTPAAPSKPGAPELSRQAPPMPPAIMPPPPPLPPAMPPADPPAMPPEEPPAPLPVEPPCAPAEETPEPPASVPEKEQPKPEEFKGASFDLWSAAAAKELPPLPPQAEAPKSKPLSLDDWPADALVRRETHPHKEAAAPHIHARAAAPVRKKYELPTALIAGKYKVVSELGHGGMSVVFEAEDVILGKKFALKKLRDEIASDKHDRDRFMTEARITAQLKHPNIVDIYTILEDKNDIYLVFELVEGKTLEALLCKYKRLPLRETAGIAMHILSALGYAHSKNVLHRDLKPSNVMVSKDGFVRVMDFGIAHVVQSLDEKGKTELSGTMAYMAPEQHIGAHDHRADVFAFGATLYEMLSGRLPFLGPDVLAQKRARQYRPLKELVPGLPEKMIHVVNKCLEPDMHDRYNSAAEIYRAIKKCPLEGSAPLNKDRR